VSRTQAVELAGQRDAGANESIDSRGGRRYRCGRDLRQDQNAAVARNRAAPMQRDEVAFIVGDEDEPLPASEQQDLLIRRAIEMLQRC